MNIKIGDRVWIVPLQENGVVANARLDDRGGLVVDVTRDSDGENQVCRFSELLPEFFKWTIEIEICASWVEDGFDMTDDRAHDWLMKMMPYAYGHELHARVLAAPPAHIIGILQGYGPGFYIMEGSIVRAWYKTRQEAQLVVDMHPGAPFTIKDGAA